MPNRFDIYPSSVKFPYASDTYSKSAIGSRNPIT